MKPAPLPSAATLCVTAFLTAFLATVLMASTPAKAADLVGRIDACLGALGAPEEHPELCMGLHAGPCMAAAEGRTTYGMVTCISEETAAWDEILNREYKALSGALDEEQATALRDVQRAWIAFRDADCAFPHIFIRGALARPWGADCVMQHTARRAVELRGYRDFLE